MTIRIPAPTLDRIDEVARRRGLRRSDVLRELLARGLDVEERESA